jgi:hypothetical protein
MKTNLSFKIAKFSTLIPLAVAIAAAVLTQPVFAVPDISIDITENSSTSLSVTGGLTVTVTNTSADRWTLTFPDVTFGTFTLNAWAEPDSSLGNIVDSPGTNQLFVLSDVVSGSTPPFPDGSTFAEPGSSFPPGQFLTFEITFHDNVTTTEGVPETGSTFVLLFVSVIALFGLNRFRHGQLA